MMSRNRMSKSRCRWPAVVALSCMLALCHGSPGALADEADEAAEADGKAKQHSAAAMKLFNAGKFKEAALEYEKAYMAKSLPEYLHDMAQCYKRLDGLEHKSKALYYFESYLADNPMAANRREVEQEIAVVKGQIEDLQRPGAKHRDQEDKPRPETKKQQPASAPVTRVHTRDHRTQPRARFWTWVVGGTAVAASIVGIGLGASVLSDRSTYESESNLARKDELRSSAQNKALASSLMFGMSGALLMTTVVIYFLEGNTRGDGQEMDRPSPGHVLRVQPFAGRACGLGLTGRF